VPSVTKVCPLVHNPSAKAFALALIYLL